ncbi:MAG TPA: hypothetical protein VGI82_06910 [Chitinophagaceae bacterium]
MVNRAVYFGSLLLAILLSDCHKPCNLPNYSFLVNETFSPEKDSIHIGDTLWLTCTIPETLKDINSQNEIDFSQAEDLASDLVISDISKFDSERGAVDSFNYTQIQGSIHTDQSADPQGVKQLSFEENSNSYLLQVGLIAKKAGAYIMTMPDNPHVYRKGMPNCGTANFQFLNGNTKQHLYLFENIWGQLSNYDSTHSYCFKVY